jgi:16S rRNA (uracil1498-N3)-methyltransferase
MPMSRRRLFVPPDQIHRDFALLTVDQTHYLSHVLRLVNGDKVELFDGEGSGYSGNLEVVGGKLRIGSLKKIDVSMELASGLTVAAALIKSSRFEWILEKGTELGVEEFIPLKTRFSNVRIPDSKLDARLKRWRRIVTESAKQCGRFVIPAVTEPKDFNELLLSESYSGHTKILLYERAKSSLKPELSPPDPRVLCIGPEGGWDPSEVEAALQAGCSVFRLSPLTLRTETAALAAIVLLTCCFAGGSFGRAV